MNGIITQTTQHTSTGTEATLAKRESLRSDSLSTSPSTETETSESSHSDVSWSGIDKTDLKLTHIKNQLRKIIDTLKKDHNLEPAEIKALIKFALEQESNFSGLYWIRGQEDIAANNPGKFIISALNELINTKEDKQLSDAEVKRKGAEVKQKLNDSKSSNSLDSLTGSKKKLTYKRFVQDLTSLAERPIDSLKIDGKEYTQTSATAALESDKSTTTTFIDSISPNSDGVKKSKHSPVERLYTERHANLGEIHVTNEDGTKRTLLTRSNKSVSKEHIKELIAFSIRSHVSADNNGVLSGHGLTIDDEGNPVFQLIISSALDTNWIKEIVTDPLGGSSENERVALEQIQTAIEEFFSETNDEGEEFLVKSPTSNDGYIKTKIKISKPLLTQFAISSQSKTSSNITEYRNSNHQVVRSLAKQLASQFKKTNDHDLLTLSEQLSGNSIDINAIREAYPELRKTLSIRQIAALNLIALYETGNTLEKESGQSYQLLGETDIISELILFRGLSEEANVAHHAECKSGEDRTLSQVALAVAAFATLFDTEPVNEEDREERIKALFKPQSYAPLKEAFSKSANEFGYNFAQIVRGKPHIKWGAKPTGIIIFDALSTSHPGPHSVFEKVTPEHPGKSILTDP